MLFGFTGRDWDTDSELQYNRARWFDPKTGRWLSQDPISFAAGDTNLYRYVGNDSTNATDPSGKIIVFVHGINSFNETEAIMLTRTLREYWRVNKMPAQEIIHFVSGGADGKPVWIYPAICDTSSESNRENAEYLNRLLSNLNFIKKWRESNENVTLITYSDGSNLGYLALDEVNEDKLVDKWLVLGGSLDNDHLYSSLYNMPEVHNFSSKTDSATWYVGGMGRFGTHRDDRNILGIHQHWIDKSHHTVSDLQASNKGEYVCSYNRERINGQTAWLTAYMVLEHYAPLIGTAGDARISNHKWILDRVGNELTPNPHDDEPLIFKGPLVK